MENWNGRRVGFREIGRTVHYKEIEVRENREAGLNGNGRTVRKVMGNRYKDRTASDNGVLSDWKNNEKENRGSGIRERWELGPRGLGNRRTSE